MLRILYFGENWHGSNARACAEGLRRLGCDVQEVDAQTFFPNVTKLTSRIVRRLFWFRMVDELNCHILSLAEGFRPDIFLAFKGNFIQLRTLQFMRSNGIALYNYYPDTSAFAHGSWLPKSLPEYDCIFHTKPFWYADTSRQIPLRHGEFLPHGYDPTLHHPVKLSPRDISDYGRDVSFIATHTCYKERILERLISLRPTLQLSIWGNGWTERCKARVLRNHIMGFAITGGRFECAIQAARINLGIMSGSVMGASSGDLTTTRTYAIPAAGGFMLHERNSEVLDLFRENEEIACFDSAEELAEKIDYYLEHPTERERIAKAGHARCVPAYSYDNRMAAILTWHFEHSDALNAAKPVA